MTDTKVIEKIDVLEEAKQALQAMTKSLGMKLVFEIKDGKPGMLCTLVEPDQSASDGGIVEGDFVTHCKIRHTKEDWTIITDEKSFDSMYCNALPGHTITFKVRRGKFSVRINVRVMAEGKEEWEVYKYANVLLEDDELESMKNKVRNRGDDIQRGTADEESRDKALAMLSGMNKQLGMEMVFVYGPIPGIKVVSIQDDQPCQKAGLCVGDIVTHAKIEKTTTGWEKLDGREKNMNGRDKFMEIFGRSRPGRHLDVRLVRNGKKKLCHIRVMAQGIPNREVERLCAILTRITRTVKVAEVKQAEEKEEGEEEEEEEEEDDDENEDEEGDEEGEEEGEEDDEEDDVMVL